MKTFQYTAISRTGDRLAGQVEGASRETVLARLQELGHFPIDIKETAAGKTSAPHAGGLLAGGPSSGQITLFTHELAMLLKAGMPLDRSLLLLAKDAPSRKLSKLIGNVHAKINDGKSLHEAMQEQGSAFPATYTSMVRIAEACGTLHIVLERIAQTRQRAEKLRGKVLSATLYPGLLITVALAAVTIMLVFVVPRFKEMVMQAGTEAPGPAHVVFAVSDWLIEHGAKLGVGLCVASALLIFLAHRPGPRQHLEGLLLKLPLIGHILRISLAIRFSRNLGMLLENGVDLPGAMKLVRNVVASERAAAAIDTASDHLRKGRSFLEPLAGSGLFPPVLINMLRVGEETGSLTQSLLHMADMFEDKLDTSVQRTLTVLEPVIILFVSAFIALVIMSILSAVISINDLAL